MGIGSVGGSALEGSDLPDRAAEHDADRDDQRELDRQQQQEIGTGRSGFWSPKR
jgi:hypothetical protein